MSKNLELEKLVKRFNGGIKSGSQTKLATSLGVSAQTVSAWINGKAIPSQENILQMAKLFNKKKEEIQENFVINSNITTINGSTGETKLLKEKIKFLEEKISFLEEQVKFYKELKNK